MDDFSVLGETFKDYFLNLNSDLERCEEANSILNL